VRIAVACKGAAKACLITDCVSACRRDTSSGAPRLPDGTIAGSILSMDRAVANVQHFAGVALEQAVEMATRSPARVIGCDKTKGSLDAGVNVLMTMIDGEVVFQR